MAMKLFVEVYNPDGPHILRDKFDRVLLGPMTPPDGIKGREYFLYVATGQKITAGLDLELVGLPVEPEPSETEVVAKCPVCDMPLTAKQVKDGRTYCGRACANKAKAQNK